GAGRHGSPRRARRRRRPSRAGGPRCGPRGCARALRASSWASSFHRGSNPPVRIGFHLTPFWSPTDRAPTAIIDDAIEVVRAASTMGFAWVSIGHHWVSHPTVWPQPIPMLARLAPETGQMRLKTSMLLLPLLNPVDVAENVVTLDHITHGRLDLGVAIGYRERELEAAGL